MNSTEQLRGILDEAAVIYEQRDQQYGDQWKKYGYRGTLYNARRKIERAWETLWNAAPVGQIEVTTFEEAERHYAPDDMPDVDDLLDTINYCAMTIMEVRAGNRDGTGGWW